MPCQLGGEVYHHRQLAKLTQNKWQEQSQKAWRQQRALFPFLILHPSVFVCFCLFHFLFPISLRVCFWYQKLEYPHNWKQFSPLRHNLILVFLVWDFSQRLCRFRKDCSWEEISIFAFITLLRPSLPRNSDLRTILHNVSLLRLLWSSITGLCISQPNLGAYNVATYFVQLLSRFHKSQQIL